VRARGDGQDRRDHERSHGATVACLFAATLGAGCVRDLDDLDSIYYDGDGRHVHCAVDLDRKSGLTHANLDAALDRAAARSQVVEIYAHNPEKTVAVADIEYVVRGAADRGLAFVTYADFASGGGTGPGLALSFDDASVAAWYDLRSLFDRYGAHVTFFISRYARITDNERAMVKQLAADGHAIEAHTVNHLNAPSYVEEHGMTRYLDDEVLPSIEVLQADGYEVSAFAYPFGARTEEIDKELLEHIPVLRSVTFPRSGVVSPCPE
jgi:Polysaccharide deacetylase